MKPKYKSETGSYGGCIASGLKLTMIGAIIIAICFVLFSCKTGAGCWKGAEPRFRYDKKFNK